MEERFPKTKLIVTVLTLIGVAIYTGLQWRQTDLIRANNVVSQRAFVFSEGWGNIASAINPKNKSESLSIQYAMVNRGNTATAGMNEPTQVSQIIGPHASVPVSCTFSMDHVGRMAHEDEAGYVVGEVRYWDRLDSSLENRTQWAIDIHVDRFIPGNLQFLDNGNWTGNPSAISVTFSPRGSHNCADEDCPP